jgi:hypothetical protein
MNFLHAACAAWKAGEEELIPWPSEKVPPAVGSGNVGSPCARMHWASASAPLPFAVVGAPVFAGTVVAVLPPPAPLCVPRVATDEEPEPPHAASPTAIARAMHNPTRSAVRRHVGQHSIGLQAALSGPSELSRLSI